MYFLKEYYFQRYFENNLLCGTHWVIVLELREDSPGPEKASWFGLEKKGSKNFAIPLHAELVQKWLLERLLENSMSQIPSCRMPWARLGWFKKARSWVTNFVEEQGWQLTGPVEQGRANIISAQIKIPTSVGNLYLKAVPPYCKNEPVFGPVLEKLLPGRVPHILQSEVENGWILMADFKG